MTPAHLLTEQGNQLAGSVVPKREKMANKVWKVTKLALLALANTAFFFLNPTLYAMSFLVGIIWDKQIQMVIDKIILLWKKQPWAMAIIGGVGGFLSLQVTLAATSILFASHLGSFLMQKAMDKVREGEKTKVKQEPFKLI